jgi:hypothetical protein
VDGEYFAGDADSFEFQIAISTYMEEYQASDYLF